MQRISIGLLALLMGLLAACEKKEEAAAPAAAPVPVAAAPVPEPPKTGNPDFGGVTRVSREVEAVGSTQELAVLSALQSAIAQVNGVRVASQMQGVRASINVSVDGQHAGSAGSEVFAQRLIAASQGAVTGYEILSQEEIDKLDEQTVAKVRASDGGYSYSASASASSERRANVDVQESASANLGQNNAQYSGAFSGSASASSSEKANVDIQRGASSYASDMTHQKMRSYWKVRVRVDVAQYKAPDEQGRPKIVVAMPKTGTSSYAVGDGRANAFEVASSVRGRLSDILTQTKRFIVLDREFGDEMQAEIDHINSGNVRAQDAARLGQQMATDLILIPAVERFEYVRSVRQLRMSDRQLVSYSGGGRITLRLLNAATGEVVMSQSFDHQLASADPSTMPRVINGPAMATEMMNSLAAQIGAAIVTEIFPVTVVALNGDQVVLSQGGESLQAGQRWQAVFLGDELRDPQTGRSLGRHESPLGVIRVDRVSNQTSYGSLEGGSGLGDRTFKPGSIVLREKLGAKAVVASSSEVPEQAAAAAAKPARARAIASEVAPPPASAPAGVGRSNDDKW